MLAFAFQGDDSLILWKENKKLSWDDFNGKANEASKYKALTESILSIAITGKGMEAVITMTANFDKRTSWVKEKRDDLLIHEQGHFDIVEIWARKFKQKLKGKTFNVKTFQKELNVLYNDVNRESKAMQVEYDRDTEHSINVKAQQKWTKKVNADLKSLSEFAPATVTCKLAK